MSRRLRPDALWLAALGAAMVLGYLVALWVAVPVLLAPPTYQAERVPGWSPPPGHVCTLVGGRPDPVCTPGARNSDVTPATLHETVCKAGWTRTIRPSPSYTSTLKRQQLDSGYFVSNDTNPADYEEDHFLSLELGGAPLDPLNLWPQPYDYRTHEDVQLGAHQKDELENELHRRICLPVDAPGYLPLAEAQRALIEDWPAARARFVAVQTSALGRGVLVDPDDEEGMP